MYLLQSWDYFLLPQGDNVIGRIVDQLINSIHFLRIQDDEMLKDRHSQILDI